jgi:hypothetical protein
MIRQSGFDRERFYGATEKAKKKILSCFRSRAWTVGWAIAWLVFLVGLILSIVALPS